jgi:hypothetical protein
VGEEECGVQVEAALPLEIDERYCVLEDSGVSPRLEQLGDDTRQVPSVGECPRLLPQQVPTTDECAQHLLHPVDDGPCAGHAQEQEERCQGPQDPLTERGPSRVFVLRAVRRSELRAPSAHVLSSDVLTPVNRAVDHDVVANFMIMFDVGVLLGGAPRGRNPRSLGG